MINMENRRGLSDNNALKLLGGVERAYEVGTIHFYYLKNGQKVALKFSKLYDNGIGYWYGITPSAIKHYKEEEITNYVFILGYEGVINIPVGILYEYIENADQSLKEDRTIKHYHIRFKFDKDIILYNRKKKYNLNEYYMYEDTIVDEELNQRTKNDILKEAKKFKDYEKQYSASENRSKIRRESKAQKERIAILEDHTCQVCGFNEGYLNSKGKKSWIIEVDHIIDKALGGGETCDNLWILCPNCHEKKTRGIIVINPNEKTITERGKPINIRDNHLEW